MSSLRFIAEHPTISLVDSYSTLRALKQIHSQPLVNGVLNDPHLSGHFVAAIALRNPTNFDNLSPYNYTFNFLVRTCAQLLARETSPTGHSGLIKPGLRTTHVFKAGLSFMYAELGMLGSCHRVFEKTFGPDLVWQNDVGFAREVFDEMPQRDPIAWNAMIAGYAQCGKSREALNLFHLMQMEGVRVNEVYMVSVLSACSHMGALDQGRCAHAYIERNKVRMTVTLGTALIDMYVKCGNMNKALEVFWDERKVFVDKRLELCSLMNKEGVHPNEATFVSVLKGCTAVGLVEEGRHFDSMRKSYGNEPQLEHCGCVLDLYGHAGRLDEALNFINNMPMKPHAGAWGALLNASRIYKNMEIAELASRKIVEPEAKNHGTYVLLSNIYADSKLWDGVSNVRLTMKAKGVRKLPGCSVLEVDGRRRQLAGYVANANPVLFNMEEEEKEDSLCKHSEKVAIVFGLITLKEGVPIRIVKNLRVCWDCHDVTKMISNLFSREIIVRDWNRFHHFKDGECSCKGYR
ncbi:unnamed protein product [Malus baccata var. baccata]